MYGADRHDRWKGAGGAAVLVAAIGYGLVAGLDVRFTQPLAEALNVIAVLPEPPPPPPAPVPAPRQARKRRDGAASPPNLTAHATQVVAPPPVLRSPPPPPVVVAPVTGIGGDPSAGAAPVIGPGSGSGGQGNGTGSGDGGDGDGGGGGEIPLRLIHGKLRYKDLPRVLIEANVGGTVGLRFDVDVTGRVTACKVTRSSGNALLDRVTCQLIVSKLRYRPTLNAAGRAVADTVDGEQIWDARPDNPGDPR